LDGVSRTAIRRRGETFHPFYTTFFFASRRAAARTESDGRREKEREREREERRERRSRD